MMGDGNTLRYPRNYEMTDTVVAFPKKHVLAEVFKGEGRDYAVFINRLHKGDSRLSHCFFYQDVLVKYMQHPDLYIT